VLAFAVKQSYDDRSLKVLTEAFSNAGEILPLWIFLLLWRWW
jgi:hypothetical protein